MLLGMVPICVGGKKKLSIIATSSGNTGTSAPTTHQLTMPPNIAAGDLLIAIVGFQATTTDVVGGMSGWTQLAKLYGGATGQGIIQAIWYKVADGSESTTPQTCTINNSRSSSHIVYRISGWADLPQASSPATASAGTAPKSGPLSPSWGLADCVWITTAAARASSPTITSYPAGYADGISEISSSSASVNVRLGSASKSEKLATETPGAFTLNSSSSWIATTVAVK